MTKIVGLTGGIGSGKTTIARLFQAEGIPVYIADEEAKKILELPDTILKIKEEFGSSIIQSDRIDRRLLAELVFNQPEKLKKLNAIIHPLVKKHFDQWVQLHRECPFIIKEAAILFESGSFKYCDKIITVTAPEELRIERVMKRDHSTRELVLDRIKNQWTDAERMEKSDYVIVNQNKEESRLQFEKILKKLKNL